MSRPRYTRAVLWALLLGAIGAQDATAQFGKIKKAVGQKGAEKAAEAAVEGATGADASCFGSRQPVVVEAFELTAVQIAKVNAGLDAEIQAAPAAIKEYDARQKSADQEQQAYSKSLDAYAKRKAEYDKCVDEAQAADAPKSEALRKSVDTAGEALAGDVNAQDMEKLGQRAQAALERINAGKGTAEDRKTMEEFQRVMGGIQAQTAQIMAKSQESSAFDQAAQARIDKACGKAPEEPKAPASVSGGAKTTAQIIQEAGAKGAGMSVAEYVALREPPVSAAMNNTVVKAGKGKSQGEADEINKQLQDTRQKLCAMRKANVPI